MRYSEVLDMSSAEMVFACLLPSLCALSYDLGNGRFLAVDAAGSRIGRRGCVVAIRTAHGVPVPDEIECEQIRAYIAQRGSDIVGLHMLGDMIYSAFSDAMGGAVERSAGRDAAAVWRARCAEEREFAFAPLECAMRSVEHGAFAAAACKAMLADTEGKTQRTQTQESARVPEFAEMVIPPKGRNAAEVMEWMHGHIDGAGGSYVGYFLLACVEQGVLKRKPRKPVFLAEFGISGSWKAVQKYLGNGYMLSIPPNITAQVAEFRGASLGILG